MSLKLYDDALTNKIQNWIKDKNLKVLNPHDTTELWKITADEKNDKPITLPLIALSRKSKITLTNTNKKPSSFDGFKIFAYDKNGNIVTKDKMQKLTAIPMVLEYQLDIYCQHQSEADEYLRNFVFNFVNFPKVNIEIPYNDCDLIHESNIYLDENVEDNSDIPERKFFSQFTRYTLNLTIDDAYMFSAPIKDNLLISSVKLDITDKDGEVLESNTILEEK